MKKNITKLKIVKIQGYPLREETTEELKFWRDKIKENKYTDEEIKKAGHTVENIILNEKDIIVIKVDNKKYLQYQNNLKAWTDLIQEARNLSKYTIFTYESVKIDKVKPSDSIIISGDFVITENYKSPNKEKHKCQKCQEINNA